MSGGRETLDAAAVQKWFETEVNPDDFAGRRVLVIVPDATRTAPLPLLFGSLVHRIGDVVVGLDVLVALGTHPAMPESSIREMLGIDGIFGAERVGLFNHEWDCPERLLQIGSLSPADTGALSDGMLEDQGL